MDNLYDKIQESKLYLESLVSEKPAVGLVLGTGLGGIVDMIEDKLHVPYKDIPHFPVSSVKSHSGELVFGRIGGRNIVICSGRWHYYEGFSMKALTFPVRVMKAIGVEDFIITNASGSLNSSLKQGDIVLVQDHINLFPENPLRGDNDERLGIRFPDMKYAYNREMIKRALSVADELGIEVKTGVYVGLQGPNLETPAEYRFLHRIGGDLVGMSTVPEVLVAVHSGMRVMVASIVANQSYPVAYIRETTHEDVIDAVNLSVKKLQAILVRMLTMI